MVKENSTKKNRHLQTRNSTAEFLIFSYQTGGDGVEVRVQGGTIWLSQKLLGQLFDTSTDNIALHLKNIFADEELSESATTEDFSVVQREGNRDVKRTVKHYNVADLCDKPVFADTIPPKPGKVSGKSLTKIPRVCSTFKMFFSPV
jgi:hypothetical protein